jgi:hypothetical protein
MKILPLDYNQQSPIINKISTDFKELLMFQSKTSCQIIINGCQLKRYCYGDLDGEQIVAVKELNLTVEGKNNNPIKVIGYVIDAGKQLIKEQQGFVSRVKNVAVEENGFLKMKSGPQSQRARVTGELYIVGLDDNEGINLDRTSFNYDYPDIEKISLELDKELEPFFRDVRNRSSEHSKAKKVLKVMKSYQSLAMDISKTLAKTSEKITPPIQNEESKPKAPKSIKSPKDILIQAGAQPSPESNIKIEYDGNSWKAKVPENILNSIEKIVVSGLEYEISFSNLGENCEPCKIIYRQIIYNLDHPLVQKHLYEPILFRILFYLAYAYNYTINKSAKDFYQQMIKLLEDWKT